MSKQQQEKEKARQRTFTTLTNTSSAGSRSASPNSVSNPKVKSDIAMGQQSHHTRSNSGSFNSKEGSGGGSGSGSQVLPPHKSPRGPSKTYGIHPAPMTPEQQQRSCECDQEYLRDNFCCRPYPPMNFHERFYDCSVCHKRPAEKVCCRTWTPYCDEHAQQAFKKKPQNHVYANYEIWQYEECFWCYKCEAYCICDAFDLVLEPLFLSKGSFVNEPVTEKHSDIFEHHNIRVGTGTMQGWRADNEDAHVVYLGLPQSGLDFFAVYDGHGGPLVARFAGRKTHELLDQLCKDGTDPEQALPKAFILTDEALAQETTPDESGSTGCTANVIVFSPRTKKIYCANAGDARSVLCRGGQAVPLSEDHRPSVLKERQRVEAAGGMVSEDDRVEGLLAVSRAFGDFDFKQASALTPAQQAVSCVPDVTARPISPDDQFIITACDGIWDCVSSQECVDFIQEQLRQGVRDPPTIVARLLDRCVAHEIPEDGVGTDNMSVVLTMLK